jgi:hypothetical protein
MAFFSNLPSAPAMPPLMMKPKRQAFPFLGCWLNEPECSSLSQPVIMDDNT